MLYWIRKHTCTKFLVSGAAAAAGGTATDVAVAAVTDTITSGDSYESLSLLFIGLAAGIVAVAILATAAAIKLADGTSLIAEF